MFLRLPVSLATSTQPRPDNAMFEAMKVEWHSDCLRNMGGLHNQKKVAG